MEELWLRENAPTSDVKNLDLKPPRSGFVQVLICDTGRRLGKPPQSVVWGGICRLQGLAKTLPGYSPLMRAPPVLL